MKIKVQNLTTGYEKDHPIIRDIDFEVAGPGITGIIGPNGSGKTTLLRALAGLLPYEGSITLTDDTSAQELSIMKRAAIAKNIALMPQFSSLYFSYTIYETVMLGRYVHKTPGLGSLLGNSSANDREAVNKALELTELTDLKDKQLTEISGGQLQRVLLARTIAQETPIILLDEPTNHLDLKFQYELVKHLKELSKSSVVIGVFHDLNLAASISDNILLLKDGEIKSKGPVSEALTRDRINEAYEIDVAKFYNEYNTFFK